MSPAKCCILCVLHSSTKRTSPCLKSCIQILDLYCRQFLQTQHNKKTVFCFWKRNKKFKNSYEIFKKLMPPQIKTSNFHSPFFSCVSFPSFFLFFFESTAGGHPRESGIPREGASEGGDFGFTLMGMGRRLDGWNFQGAEICLIQNPT